MASPKASCANMLIPTVPTPFPVVSHVYLPVNLRMENSRAGAQRPGAACPQPPECSMAAPSATFTEGRDPKAGFA